MTQPHEPTAPDLLRDELRTRHPGIVNEIEGAINTLQKLRQITGTIVPEDSGSVVPNVLDPGATLDVPDRRLDDTDKSGKPRSPAPAPVRRKTGQNVPALAASESFGRYQIVRVLGQGAMGAVYLAYDSQLERHVALKTPFLGDQPEIIARFYREARAAAQLRSPFICPIYDVGQIGDIYYLSMAYIDGQSLTRAMTSGQITDHKLVANVVKKIARGLQKAHDQGVVHRDLKPDNIMLDSDGEPIVMDFGVARRIDDEVQLTTPGRLIGTPSYMSPEQVEADPMKVGPATDIYSLGVVLYVMITGRLPFQGSLTSVLRQIGSQEPQRPSVLNPQIIKGCQLESVCLKMMAKSQSDRFPNMTAVADALEKAFPRGDVPVAAPSLWRRMRSLLLTRVPTQAPEANGSAPGSGARPLVDTGSMTMAE